MTLDSCVYMAGPRLWVCALDMIQASSNPMGHRLAHLDFSGKGLEARTGGKLPGLLQGPRDQHHGDMAHRPRGSVANQQMLLGKTGRGRTCSSQCFWCRRCYWITLSFNWFCFSMISEGFEIISASFAYFMRNMTLDWGSQKRLLSPTLMALSRLGKKKTQQCTHRKAKPSFSWHQPSKAALFAGIFHPASRHQAGLTFSIPHPALALAAIEHRVD